MIKIGKIEAQLIDSGYNTAKFNMDYDLELIEKVKKSGNSYFRIYGWKPWALSLGKNQSDEKIERNKLERNSFDLVRRPTGGRAVFHANELTYSFVTDLSNKNHHIIYKDVHLFFEHIFNELGVKTDFAKGETKLNQFYKNELSESCFASSARYELTIEGKKLVGSAQRIIDNILLQHGSIPIDNSYLKIADFQKSIDSLKIRSFLEKNSTCLSKANKAIDYNKIREFILDLDSKA